MRGPLTQILALAASLALGCSTSGVVSPGTTSSGAGTSAGGQSGSGGGGSSGSSTGTGSRSTTGSASSAKGTTGAGSSSASSTASSSKGNGSTGAAGSSSGGSGSGAGSSSGSTGSSEGGSSGSSSGGSSSGGTGPGDGGFYNLGLNFPGLNYYNNAAIYADMTLQMAGNSGPWDVATGSDAAAPLDSTGAPTVAAWAGVTGEYPSGAYTVTWDGTGSISVSGLGTPTVTTSNGVQHNSATLNWTQQLSTTSNAAWVQFKATPPVTNIHILAPAANVSSDGVFLNDLLARLKPFSNIRFMDALNTNSVNNGGLQNWSQRSWPSAGSRANTLQGMAYEDIIALANQTGLDVWINVPGLATDDYVCRLARLFKYGEQGDMSNTGCDPTAAAGTATTTPLNSKSTLYVEYSNEIWNWGFQQIEDNYCMVFGVPDKTGNGKHCNVTAPTSAVGVAALADSSLPWDSTNTYGKAGQFTMILEKRQSDIFRTVFGCTSGAGCQVQIPMNVQAAYPAEADEGFKFLVSAYGSTGALDAMAVAPYFNTDADANNDSVNDIFTDLATVLATNPPSSDGNATVNWLKADIAEAAPYGLPIIAYEGGQGLSSGDYTANTISAQSDPRMFTDTQAYFALWDSLVGRKQLFNYYTFVDGDGSYGCWGALLNVDDPGSQKWDALITLTRTPGDANLDGVVNAADCTILTANYGKTGLWWMEGDFNHDGSVDSNDLAILNANITGGACPTPP